MKPKFHRAIRNVLPTFIVVSSVMPMAHSGQIDPDSAGNILVPGNYNGGLPAADTINASGGTTSPFRLEILNGAQITGDAATLHGIIVSSANYTIINRGSVNAANGRGLSATEDFTLNNYGLIQGNNNYRGISGNGGGTLINNFGTGVIRSVDVAVDAIQLVTDGGEVDNSGLIESLGGDGIQSANSFILNNQYGGTITGGGRGVYAGNLADLTNYGSISSSGSTGVVFGDDGSFGNFDTFLSPGVYANGDVTGQINGVQGGNLASIRNEGYITGTTGNGVVILNGNGLDINVWNAPGQDSNAEIKGAVTGISGGDGILIVNDYNAKITGGTGDGITSGLGLILDNSGSITTTAGSGVSTGAGSVIRNYGNSLIEGNIGVTATGGAALITNRSTIRGTGGDAVILGDNAGVGNNLLALDDGYVDGNVTATGTGNRITSSGEDEIEGNITGVQNIDVLSFGGLLIDGDVTGPTSATVAADGYLYGTGIWQMDINVATDGMLYAWDGAYGGVIVSNGNVLHQADSILGFAVNPNLQITNDGVNAGLISSVAGTYDATGPSSPLSHP